MMRYLVLIDRPFRGATATSTIAELSAGAVSAHVVVPARALSQQKREFVHHELAGDEAAPDEVIAARRRLRNATAAPHEAGFDDGEVGAADSLDAATSVLDRERYDTVIVVTTPLVWPDGSSFDPSSRLERHVDVPVITIEADVPSSV